MGGLRRGPGGCEDGGGCRAVLRLGGIDGRDGLCCSACGLEGLDARGRAHRQSISLFSMSLWGIPYGRNVSAVPTPILWARVRACVRASTQLQRR